jgi:hypothetical protein
VRSWLEALEASISAGELEEPRPAIALVAGQGVVLDEHELHGARRRALLLLATGGDPRRGLALDSRAVTALADDLADERGGEDLARGLSAIRALASDLPLVARALDSLLEDASLAWRAFACALLAEELGGDY